METYINNPRLTLRCSSSDGNSTVPRCVCKKVPVSLQNAQTTRRAFLHITALGGLSALLPNSAKGASTGSHASLLSEAEEARAAFMALSDAVTLASYSEFRLALRGGALGKTRKVCAALYLDMDEAGRKAEAKKHYKELISAVEKIDVDVLKASRGGNRQVVQKDFENVLHTFDTFLATVR